MLLPEGKINRKAQHILELVLQTGRPGHPKGAGGAVLIGFFYVRTESSGDKDHPNATILSYFTRTP